MESFLKRVLAERAPNHAYLFFGSGSSPKEERAVWFASSLLCRADGEEACGSCVSCRKIKSGNHPDFRIVAPDGERIKIEQVRPLKAEMQFGPLESRWKVYLFLKSESMTEPAAQSLLKMLEEPPARIVMILCAPHPSAILPTLASRCQWVPVEIPSSEARARRLQELGVGEAQARALAFLQIGDAAAEEWTRVIKEIPPGFFSEAGRPFEIFEKASLIEDYKESPMAAAGLALAFYRDVMALKAGWPEGGILPGFQEAAAEAARTLSWGDLWKKIQAILDAREFLEKSGNFRMVMDSLLHKLLSPR